MAGRYEVTFLYDDGEGVTRRERRIFTDKEDAIQFAKRAQFKMNDQFVGDPKPKVSEVKLYAITETRHDITERIFLNS